MSVSGRSPDQAKLRWRCRRGTKELDVLTTRYLDHFYGDASTEEQWEFAAMLDMQDPELYLILSRKQPPNGSLQEAIVAKIHSL